MTNNDRRTIKNVEIPRGMFVEISSILKGKSTWKKLHRFDVEVSTWIRLSKSMKYPWVLQMDFYDRRNFCARCSHSMIS